MEISIGIKPKLRQCRETEILALIILLLFKW